MKRRMVSLVAVAICVIAVGLMGAAAVNAAPAEAKPKPKPAPARSQPARIAWTPRVVTSTQSLSAGESFTTTVTFTSTKTVSNVVASLVPMHGARLTITPTTFSVINAGESYTVTIAVTAPARLRRGAHHGTVYLREGRRLLANPLSVRWNPRR